jgi:murein L,D-transpeptidase YcbB/YkuD
MLRATMVRTALLFLALIAGALPAGADTFRWVQNGRLTPQAQEVLGAMRRAEDFGLAGDDFTGSVADIVSLEASLADASRLDASMNEAALRLINQLHHGRADPRAAAFALGRRRAPLDPVAALERLATAGDASEVLATFEPRSAQYRALKQALSRYRSLRTDLTSLPAPGSSAVRTGDTYAGAAKLRWLLAEIGDAPAPRDDPASESRYDAALAAGIANFQRRHGLDPDGVLGPRTFAALTVPFAQRIRQMELTLERWRWLPDIDPPAVIVNVPQYVLYTLPDRADASAGSVPSRIPVIVGQSARQTPVFDSEIESVIFRPYWNVPASILHEELLPLIRADPGYLARHDMEIVRGEGDAAEVLPADAAGMAALRAGRARLRQRPGPANALGLIKFVLPNPYAVFLHSTPDSQLFSRERRALSHGCIRVSDASALAAYLLKDTPGDWSPDAIEAATCGTTTFTVRLARPVPVFILYGTVVVDTDGAVLFFDDIYGYDRRLEALLTGAVTPVGGGIVRQSGRAP